MGEKERKQGEVQKPGEALRDAEDRLWRRSRQKTFPEGTASSRPRRQTLRPDTPGTGTGTAYLGHF